MWIDQVSIRLTDALNVMDERRIGQLLTPVINRFPARPDVVIDARPAVARDGATATYRLLAALGLPSAAPVTVSFARRDGAIDILESLLAATPGGGPLLLVIATRVGPSHLAGCCLLADRPITADSVQLRGLLNPEAGEPVDAFAGVVLSFSEKEGFSSPIP
jgi:hypothetical protein